MTTPLVFELNAFDITVQDPASVQSWMLGLKPLIDDLASDQPFYRFEHYDNISDEYQNKIGQAVVKAIASYRAGAEGDSPFNKYVEWALYDLLADDTEDKFNQFYSRRPVDNLYDDIEELMSEYDGPVAGIDEVIEVLHYEVEEKINENDDSTALDCFRRHRIRLNFNPAYNPLSGGVDDLMLTSEYLRNHLDGDEAQALLNFLKIPKKDVIPLLDLDFKETEAIRKAIAATKNLKHDRAPLLEAEKIRGMFDNCGDYHIYPHWHGEIDFDDLLKMDPKKPMQINGGVIAFLDITNGSGDYSVLPSDRAIVIEPDQTFSWKHWSYDIYDIFGSDRDFEADVSELKEPTPENNQEPTKARLVTLDDEPQLG